MVDQVADARVDVVDGRFAQNGVGRCARGLFDQIGEGRLALDDICRGTVAKPFWVKIKRGKHGAPDLTLEAVRKVHELSKGLAICILDRSGDGIPTLRALLDDGIASIIRIAKMDRDVFGTGRNIDEEISRRTQVHADLRRNSGKVSQKKWGTSL